MGTITILLVMLIAIYVGFTAFSIYGSIEEQRKCKIKFDETIGFKSWMVASAMIGVMLTTIVILLEASR